jgi:hypothetical protein
MGLHKMLWVLLHEVYQRYTCLRDKLINDTAVIVVQVSNDEEELPHAG